MKNKIAKAGINQEILNKACETGGMDALSILLRENVEGKPRVTNNKKFHKYFIRIECFSMFPCTREILQRISSI